MGATKFSKSIFAIMCLLLLALTINCYGAVETAEEYFEQYKKFSSVENSDHAIHNYTESYEAQP